MATVHEGGAHSVYHMFFSSNIMAIHMFSYFPLCLRGRDFRSDCISSCSLLTITFHPTMYVTPYIKHFGM